LIQMNLGLIPKKNRIEENLKRKAPQDRNCKDTKKPLNRAVLTRNKAF